MGIAVGAGFYECAAAGLLLIYLSVRLMPHVEEMLAVHRKDISLYIEFYDVSGIGTCVNVMNRLKLEILELEFGMEADEDNDEGYPNAIVRLNVPSGLKKEDVVVRLSALKCVHLINRAD